METKNIILIVIVILVVVLAAAGIYFTSHGSNNLGNITNVLNTTDNSTNATVENTTNVTVIGDDTPLENTTAGNNTTYKVYNPQSDSYVPVIGEKYDDEVNRWYTYDSDGVRYYNTRIN